MTCPAMQHRHFVFIAATIAQLDPAVREQVAQAFARDLRATNGQFDRDRFLDAARGTPAGRDKVRA